MKEKIDLRHRMCDAVLKGINEAFDMDALNNELDTSVPVKQAVRKHSRQYSEIMGKLNASMSFELIYDDHIVPFEEWDETDAEHVRFVRMTLLNGGEPLCKNPIPTISMSTNWWIQYTCGTWDGVMEEIEEKSNEEWCAYLGRKIYPSIPSEVEMYWISKNADALEMIMDMVGEEKTSILNDINNDTFWTSNGANSGMAHVLKNGKMDVEDKGLSKFPALLVFDIRK